MSVTRTLPPARAGLGIVQTFTYSLKPALASGELVEILSAWRPAPYPFTLSMPGTGIVPPRLRVFIDWLAAVFPASRCRDSARYLTRSRSPYRVV